MIKSRIIIIFLIFFLCYNLFKHMLIIMNDKHKYIAEFNQEDDGFSLWKNSIQDIIFEVSTLYPTDTKKRKSFNRIIEQLSTDYFTIHNNLRYLKDKKFNIQDISIYSLDSEYIEINNLFKARFGNFSNSAVFDMYFNSTLSKNKTGIFIHQKEKYGFDDLKRIDFTENNTYNNVTAKAKAKDINQIFEKYIKKNLLDIQRNYNQDLASGLLVISTLKPFFKILSSINFSSNDIFDKNNYYSTSEIYEKILNIKDIIELSHEIKLDNFLKNFKLVHLNELQKDPSYSIKLNK